MNIKGLQRKAKEITKNEKTGKFNVEKDTVKVSEKKSWVFYQTSEVSIRMTGGTVMKSIHGRTKRHNMTMY